MLARDPSELYSDALRVTITVMVLTILCKASEPVVGVLAQADTAQSARTFADHAQHYLQMATQDKQVQAKMQHIYTASVYLQTARHMANDAVLERLTGYDIHHMQTSIETLQGAVNRDFAKQCPKTLPLVKKRASWM